MPIEHAQLARVIARHAYGSLRKRRVARSRGESCADSLQRVAQARLRRFAIDTGDQVNLINIAAALDARQKYNLPILRQIFECQL